MGFNGVGEVAFQRTYSRLKPDGTKETWPETVFRVVEGTFEMQRRLVPAFDRGEATSLAQQIALKMVHFKFTPPGRGLWAMGTYLTNEEAPVYTALNNCAFVSTQRQADPTRPYTFLLDSSLLGVGVGFDTLGAGASRVYQPREDAPPRTHVVQDSREGWVNSLHELLDSYFREDTQKVSFDYSKLSERGVELRSMGGVSAGPAAIRAIHEDLRGVLS